MIIERINENTFEPFPPCAAMIGSFDGFHHGHQQLIEQTLISARNQAIESAVITFDPDPDDLFHADSRGKITKLEERIQLAQSFGFDRFYICSFSRSFAAMSIEQFHQFLVNLNIFSLVCGFDFTYGKNASGTVNTLKDQKDFDVIEISCFENDHEKVSSTRIKQGIEQGRMEEVREWLGYCYSIPGVVETGFQRGSHLLGFPTANLKVEKGYTIPKKGVYAGYVLLEDKAWPSMINVGYNPTFKNETLTVEANIFNFSRDIYGEPIRVFFCDYLRPEKPFDSVEALKEQLESDRTNSMEVLAKLEPYWTQTCRLWRING